MINLGFDKVISADDNLRLGLYKETAQRLGTTSQNVEKDFWVCWTLDALFNGMIDRPRLLFKGGTSLSKGFGLIERFSEDIDITVFRDDIGKPFSIEDLEALSGNQRRKTLETIRVACVNYINGPCLKELTKLARDAEKRNGLVSNQIRIVPDTEDSQSLKLEYPSATPVDKYIDKSVKIESGLKSALEPNSELTVRPYLDDDTPDFDLSVGKIITIEAERTFWDKVVILHGLRNWFEKRGELKGDGHRVSRHYYDIYMLMKSDIGKSALKNQAMGADCVAHARMFFDRAPYNLAKAVSPTFSIQPENDMSASLTIDYSRMSGMIFGKPPEFELIL